MVDKDLLQKALNYCYFFLKFRPRTKKEINDYLVKKTKRFRFTQELIVNVIKELEEEGLIDDKKFVEWFIEQRNLSKPKSEFVLTGELLRHGINKELIDEYFDSHELNEDDLALKTLESRWQRFKNLPVKERFEKSANFLLRRGFSFEKVRRTIEKITENNLT